VGEALTTAAKSRLVDLDDQQIGEALDRFNAFSGQVRLSVPAPGSSATYAELLQSSGVDEPVRERFAQVFLAQAKQPVDSAVFGVAGPVNDGQCIITNLPWIITEAGLRQALGLQEVTLLNDLEAAAYGLAYLAPEELAVLNEAPPDDGPKAIIGAGTGLGEAILFRGSGRIEVIASEGGHTDFAPTNLFQIELLRYMLGKYGHASYERVCSGKGIPNVYAYLRDTGYAEEVPRVADALRQADDPTPIIVQEALSGGCELCIETLNTFVSILGAEAGNLALKVAARGGVYLGGGIPPRILSKLKDGTFMAAFVNKGRFAGMLARIPVYVIMKPDTALLGAACFGLGL
jgi:glucokinase